MKLKFYIINYSYSIYYKLSFYFFTKSEKIFDDLKKTILYLQNKQTENIFTFKL